MSECQSKEREKIDHRGQEITTECSGKLSKGWGRGRDRKSGNLGRWGRREAVVPLLLSFHL